MSETSVLDDVTVAYRPFTVTESHVLRSFVDGARLLGHMKFFDEVPTTASISFGQEAGLGSSMSEPSDEALRAALTQFRQLYSPNEPHSFHRTIRLLKQSAHEHNGRRHDEAMAALNEFPTAAKGAMAGIGVAIVFENPTTGKQRKMTSAQIIDAYLHGQYLHSGNAKTKLAKVLDDIPVMARLIFYSVMLNLRNVYWCAANAVDRVLAINALLDANEPSSQDA